MLEFFFLTLWRGESSYQRSQNEFEPIYFFTPPILREWVEGKRLEVLQTSLPNAAMGGGKEVGSLANEFTERCEMLQTKEIK